VVASGGHWFGPFLLLNQPASGRCSVRLGAASGALSDLASTMAFCREWAKHCEGIALCRWYVTPPPIG